MDWERVKRAVASRIMTFLLNDVDKETKQQIVLFTAEDFAKYYERFVKEKERFKVLMKNR